MCTSTLVLDYADAHETIAGVVADVSAKLL